MSKYFEEIDRLSRESLREWEIPPPLSVSAKVQQRMRWTNFVRKTRSRVGLITVFLLLLSVPTLLYIYHDSSPMKAGSLNNISSPSQIERPMVANPSIQTDVDELTTPDYNTPLAFENHHADNANGISSNTPISNTKNQDSPNTFDNTAENVEITSISQPDFSETSKQQSEIGPISTYGNTTNSSWETPVTSSLSNINAVRMNAPLRAPYLTSLNFTPEIRVQKANTHSLHTRQLRFSMQLDLSAQFAGLNEKQEVIKSSPSMMTAGGSLTAALHYKNFFLETGLQYTQLQTKQQSKDLAFNPATSIDQILSGQQLNIDTSGYWFYRYIQDSMIHVFDSVWITEFDSTYQNLYEEITQTTWDTLESSEWKTGISLIEIPIGLGYRFYAGRTALDIKAGVLLGFVTQTIGRTYLSTSSAGLVPLTEMYNKKGMQYSYYISLGVSKQLTEKWAILMSPSWRGSINGLSGREGIPSRSYHSFGIGVGARYDF